MNLADVSCDRWGISTPQGESAMTPLVRAAVITALFAIAIAQAAFGIARAQPKDQLPRCHASQVCTVIPAKTIQCPPPAQQTAPCKPHTIPAHKVCTPIQVCDN
jgi:hypothetical protein